MTSARECCFRSVASGGVTILMRVSILIYSSPPQLVHFVQVLFTQAWQLRYTGIDCLASVLSGLAPYHPKFATAVVDDVVEDIRIGMEVGGVVCDATRRWSTHMTD